MSADSCRGYSIDSDSTCCDAVLSDVGVETSPCKGIGEHVAACGVLYPVLREVEIGWCIPELVRQITCWIGRLGHRSNYAVNR